MITLQYIVIFIGWYRYGRWCIPRNCVKQKICVFKIISDCPHSVPSLRWSEKAQNWDLCHSKQMAFNIRALFIYHTLIWQSHFQRPTISLQQLLQDQGKFTLHQLQGKLSASVICQRNVNTKGGLHARGARWETSSAVNVYNCLLWRLMPLCDLQAVLEIECLTLDNKAVWISSWLTFSDWTYMSKCVLRVLLVYTAKTTIT